VAPPIVRFLLICLTTFWLCVFCTVVRAQPQPIDSIKPRRPNFKTEKVVQCGAARKEVWLPMLEERNVALVANHSSKVDGKHLLDILLENGVALRRIFAPEHGFEGMLSAGEAVRDSKLKDLGVKVISLYGRNKKPTYDHLADVDVVVFDIQDVGVRYYTYISTMHYVMQACAEMGKEFIVLDRPNPNGFYVDGPVLEPGFTSFVGLHPVPLVHGMTIGEYAQMINGEGWLGAGLSCSLQVVPCQHYDHNDFYMLPEKPSPNLPNMAAVFLYPSLGLFEGTRVSVGRGTEKPFQYIGFPGHNRSEILFAPVAREGAAKPPYEGDTCGGYDLEKMGMEVLPWRRGIYLHWLLNMYAVFPDKSQFFLPNNFIDLLAGTNRLRLGIVEGKKEEEIRAEWEKGIGQFRKTRAKYLLYPDFD
jgi:uncharacterized protein YbbC (DUF1343 family)